MTSLEERERLVNHINDAIANGARKVQACETLGLTIRTLQRWSDGTRVKSDKRPEATRK